MDDSILLTLGITLIQGLVWAVIFCLPGARLLQIFSNYICKFEPDYPTAYKALLFCWLTTMFLGLIGGLVGIYLSESKVAVIVSLGISLVGTYLLALVILRHYWIDPEKGTVGMLRIFFMSGVVFGIIRLFTRVIPYIMNFV
ncbi:MAG: hypothetical protein RBU29_07490 [bacterium]|nr:hypothetical protein [bacterium]